MHTEHSSHSYAIHTEVMHTVGVKKTVTLPFHPVPFRRKRNGRSPCPRMETGRVEADTTENAVDYSNRSQHENVASKA